MPAASGSGSSRSGSTGRSRPQSSFAPSRKACGRSRCSTARRSPARSESRSTSTPSRHSPSRAAPCRSSSGGRYGLSSKEFTAGHGRGRVRRARTRAAEAAVHDRDRRRRLGDEPALRSRPGHRAGGDRPRRLLRARLGRHRRREQEHDQDPRRRRGSPRPGLLRLRLEEVGLADGVAPSLRPAPHPVPVPGEPRKLRRLPPAQAARPARGARPRGARRHAAAQLPVRPRRCLGEALPPVREQIVAKGIELYAIDAGRIAREAGLRAAPTRSSRRASSRPPGFCHARKRSPASRRRSRRPTAGEATRSSGATTPPSTALSPGCTRSTSLGSPAAGTRSPCSSRTMHPSSFAR